MSQMNLSLSLRSQLLMGGIDAYAVIGFKPDLAFDFAEEYYRVNNTQTSFSDSITHSASSNATMVDESGVLKWRPHNLLTYSDDFSGAGWSSNTATTITAVSGGYEISHTNSTADFGRGAVPNTNGFDVKLNLEVTYVDHQWLRIYHANDGGSGSTWFDIQNGVVGTDQSNGATITSLGGGKYRLSMNVFRASAAVPFIILLAQDDNSGLESVGTTAVLHKAWVYRSDLGMVNNPDTGDSYVPTTSAAVYLPRRGHHAYNGSAWVNEGLLHESEARTNLITYSEDFTNAAWGKARSTVTGNSVSSPTGENTADTLSEDSTAASTHYVYSDLAGLADDTEYTLSAWVKAANRNWALLEIRTKANSFRGAHFDLSTGTAGTVSAGATSSIQSAGNGWYLCSVTVDVGSGATTPRTSIYAAEADNDSVFDGLSQDSIYLYGAQLEAGSTPSSYIPTAGSTATRAAETLTIPAANLPWPTPQVIGDELVTNGTFDSDLTGWTDQSESGGSVAWNSAGIALTTGVDGTQEGRAYQTISTTAGKVYRLTATRSGAASRFDVSGINSFAAEIYISPTTTSSIDFVFVATSSTTYLNLRNLTAFNSTAYIDNISVREINPLAVSIQMDGAITYANEGAADTARFFLWLADGSNYIFADIDTNASAGTCSINQAAAGVSDGVESDSEFTPGINSSFSIASRHGSTFINGAVDGVEIGEDVTPVALPDLSSTDLNLGYDYMGTIKTFRVWAADLGDTGIEDATLPSLEPSLSLTFDGSEASFTVDDWSE